MPYSIESFNVVPVYDEYIEKIVPLQYRAFKQYLDDNGYSIGFYACFYCESTYFDEETNENTIENIHQRFNDLIEMFFIKTGINISIIELNRDENIEYIDSINFDELSYIFYINPEDVFKKNETALDLENQYGLTLRNDVVLRSY